MSTKTEDTNDLAKQIKSLSDRLLKLEKEQQVTGVMSARFDEILLEKNNIRIKLTALRIRLEYLGNLSGFALPDNYNTIPKRK
jgi:hypothetical protein